MNAELEGDFSLTQGAVELARTCEDDARQTLALLEAAMRAEGGLDEDGAEMLKNAARRDYEFAKGAWVQALTHLLSR